MLRRELLDPRGDYTHLDAHLPFVRADVLPLGDGESRRPPSRPNTHSSLEAQHEEGDGPAPPGAQKRPCVVNYNERHHEQPESDLVARGRV